ncbi:MAG: hypothetical protein LC799_34065 [Actinobacteria bacterium]|nr:hypothetical protein [Actinomycetota bacterium]
MDATRPGSLGTARHLTGEERDEIHAEPQSVVNDLPVPQRADRHLLDELLGLDPLASGRLRGGPQRLNDALTRLSPRFFEPRPAGFRADKMEVVVTERKPLIHSPT